MEDKVKKVMSEFKAGELTSSSGKKVTSRKQALAIALAMQQKAKGKKKELDPKGQLLKPFCNYILIAADRWATLRVGS